MELLSNGTSHKNNSTTEQKDKSAKPQITTKAPQIATGKTEPQKPKPEPPKPESQQQPTEPVKPEQPKPSMNLDEKLKVVNELYRKSVQRINLISRIKQLETFEINLAKESDELSDNRFQGCKLIIRDDKANEFITTTPGLIRKIAQFIYDECNLKLTEIETLIDFPSK